MTEVTLDSPAGLLSGFMTVLSRELKLTVRRRQQWLNPLFFFVIVVSLFPLGVGPSGTTLSLIAPGVLWVAALLALLLSLDTLFSSEHRDGTLEQLVLCSQPLSILVLAKVTAHWLVSALPLVVLAPLLGLLLHLNTTALPVLMLSLALGTITLALLGAIGAALTTGLRYGSVLVAVLVMPLYVPVLIFGTSAVSNAAAGRPAEGQLWMLAAMAMVSLALAPWAIAASLRVAVSAE